MSVLQGAPVSSISWHLLHTPRGFSQNSIDSLSTDHSTHSANVYHHTMILGFFSFWHRCSEYQVALSVVALQWIHLKQERVKLCSLYPFSDLYMQWLQVAKDTSSSEYFHQKLGPWRELGQLQSRIVSVVLFSMPVPVFIIDIVSSAFCSEIRGCFFISCSTSFSICSLTLASDSSNAMETLIDIASTYNLAALDQLLVIPLIQCVCVCVCVLSLIHICSLDSEDPIGSFRRDFDAGNRLGFGAIIYTGHVVIVTLKFRCV